MRRAFCVPYGRPGRDLCVPDGAAGRGISASFRAGLPARQGVFRPRQIATKRKTKSSVTHSKQRIEPHPNRYDFGILKSRLLEPESPPIRRKKTKVDVPLGSPTFTVLSFSHCGSRLTHRRGCGPAPCSALLHGMSIWLLRWEPASRRVRGGAFEETRMAGAPKLPDKLAAGKAAHSKGCAN
jgi:hypothetical protein